MAAAAGANSPYGPVPPEALESSENKRQRTVKKELFKRLNNESNPAYNHLRANWLRGKGKTWKNSRKEVLAAFEAEQAAKAQRRFNALKRHRNAEWAAYIEEWRRTHPPPPPGSGLPAQGPPPRIYWGYGGRKTRKRNTKKNVRRRRY